MNIEVRLFATLRNERWKRKEIDCDVDTTPREVIKELKIDEKDVAILLINGISGELDDKLNDKDVLSIFPPVGGG